MEERVEGAEEAERMERGERAECTTRTVNADGERKGRRESGEIETEVDRRREGRRTMKIGKRTG